MSGAFYVAASRSGGLEGIRGVGQAVVVGVVV